jgi:hypothetical protein
MKDLRFSRPWKCLSITVFGLRRRVVMYTAANVSGDAYINTSDTGEIPGSQGEECKDDCLLRCRAMQFDTILPTFQRRLLLPSSGRWLKRSQVLCTSTDWFSYLIAIPPRPAYLIHWWWRQQTTLKRQKISTRLHGSTFRKIITFKLAAVRKWI